MDCWDDECAYVCDRDGDGSLPPPWGTDCEDGTARIHPGADEVCDGLDNDCDNLIDDDDPDRVAPASYVWFADADGDGFGDLGQQLISCSLPEGYSSDYSDCDDANDDINPSAVEVCDEVDNDCDGDVDDADADLELTTATTWYSDADADMLGDGSTGQSQCLAPVGWVDNGDDCDDADAESGGAIAWLADLDSDGFGVLPEVVNCDPAASWVPPGGDDDCDDLDPQRHPDADEACGATVDQNCDGAIWPEMWTDLDNDGYGLASAPIVDCRTEPVSATAIDGDCNDVHAGIHPGAVETCNGEDDDCDGVLVDEADDDLDQLRICDGDLDDALFQLEATATHIPGGFDVVVNVDGAPAQVDAVVHGTQDGVRVFCNPAISICLFNPIVLHTLIDNGTGSRAATFSIDGLLDGPAQLQVTAGAWASDVIELDLPACGDGVWDAAFEECDDGNEVLGDGCSECVVDYCGDGELQPLLGEECDDVDLASNPYCTLQCERTLKQLSSFANHTCGIDLSGNAICWGDDVQGQSSPPAGSFTDISAGGDHTCAIDTTGTVQCWGLDDLGQATPPSGTFTSVSAGEKHTCAIDDTGAAHCWGWNSYGQAAPPSGGFLQIATGQFHSCGILADHSLVCWGRDDGSAGDYGQVTDVPGGLFSSISAGTDHNCAVHPGSSQVLCWGRDNVGQSTALGPLWDTEPIDVECGAWFSCTVGMSTGMPIDCWGADASGQQSIRYEFVQGEAAGQIDLAAGADHACVNDLTGRIVCVGNDSLGQIQAP